MRQTDLTERKIRKRIRTCRLYSYNPFLVKEIELESLTIYRFYKNLNGVKNIIQKNGNAQN